MSFSYLQAKLASIGGMLMEQKVISGDMVALIDFNPAEPLNEVIGFDPITSNLVLGAGFSGVTTDLIIANQSSAQALLLLDNTSPGGNSGIVSDNVVLEARTVLSISIEGDTGLTGAVLTSFGDGSCGWVGGSGLSSNKKKFIFPKLDIKSKKVGKITQQAILPKQAQPINKLAEIDNENNKLNKQIDSLLKDIREQNKKLNDRITVLEKEFDKINSNFEVGSLKSEKM